MPGTEKQQGGRAAHGAGEQGATDQKRAELEGKRILIEMIRSLEYPVRSGSKPPRAGVVAVFKDIQRNYIAHLENELLEFVQP